MEKFLTSVAKHILNKRGNDLSDVTVLMPNHRSCLFLRQALWGSSTQTIWSPQIMTLEDWVYSKSGFTLIQPLEQLMELYSVYKEHGGEDPLDEFIPVGQTMLSDFNEVDMHLTDARIFFDNLENLQSMKAYEPGAEPSEYTLKYQKFWHTFRELYFDLRAGLSGKEKGYEGLIYRQVAEKLSGPDLADYKVDYVIGFSFLKGSEEKIIKTLRKNGTEIIWDTDNYYTHDEYQEAGSFYRKYHHDWRVSDERWRNDLLKSEKKNINIVGVAKSIGQTRVVADILVNKLELNAESEKETVIVVPDEKLLDSLLAAIPANISEMNVSMGFPLRESLIAGLLKVIFSLHENVERFRSKKSDKIRFYYNDVFDALRHPYSAYILTDKEKSASFIEFIRERNSMVITYEELSTRFKETGFNKIFWYTGDTKEYLAKLLELIEELRMKFLTVTQSGEKDLSIDIELLFKVHNLLMNLQNTMSGSEQDLSVQSLRKLLTETVGSVRVPFEGEPVKGLQIMGVMETRNLDFKNVIILSMNEGIFPAGKTYGSYIPYEMQREFLSTYIERDADSAYLFYRLLQRAENVFLIYNTEGDDLGGGEKSRFIMQLQHELKQVNKNAIINDFIYSVPPPPETGSDEINIVKSGELIAKLSAYLAEHGISPSALNTYINCSLQFYLRYVSGLYVSEDIEESIEAATLGSAVHDVLENLYKDSLEKELSYDFLDKAITNKKRIEELLHKTLAKKFDKESLKEGKNYLLYRVCLKLVTEFLKQEKNNLERMQKSGDAMKLLMLENKMDYDLQVGAHKVKIQGKVDRVEEVNGVINIADYKTGTPAGSSIKSEDAAMFATDPKYAKAMQLLTYAWLYWRNNHSPVISLRSGIYWLREIAKGFDALKIDNNDIITPETLLQFEQVLQDIIAEILNAVVPFRKTEKIERCDNCEFVRICRRD